MLTSGAHATGIQGRVCQGCCQVPDNAQDAPLPEGCLTLMWVYPGLRDPEIPIHLLPLSSFHPCVSIYPCSIYLSIHHLPIHQ